MSPYGGGRRAQRSEAVGSLKLFSTDYHTINTLHRSSSAHPPILSEAHNNYIYYFYIFGK